MTVEELLKPRVKCIAPFLGMEREGWKLNTVISENLTVEDLQLPIIYPHLFCFLEWWRYRTIEDFKIIKYAKVIKYVGYWRVGDIAPVDSFECSADTHGGLVLKTDHFHALCNVEPATEEDYNAFRNSDKF